MNIKELLKVDLNTVNNVIEIQLLKIFSGENASALEALLLGGIDDTTTVTFELSYSMDTYKLKEIYLAYLLNKNKSTAAEKVYPKCNRLIKLSPKASYPRTCRECGITGRCKVYD